LTGMRDPEFRYVADFEYWLRLGLYGPFARIPKTLATFRVHSDSASEAHRGAAMAAEHVRLMEKFYSRPDLPLEVFKVRSEAFSHAHYAAGMACGVRRKEARKHYLKALKYQKPTSLTDPHLTGLISTVLPKSLFGILRLARRTIPRMLGFREQEV